MANTINILLVTLFVLHLVTLTNSEGEGSKEGKPEVDVRLQTSGKVQLARARVAQPQPRPQPQAPKPKYGKRSIARLKPKKRGKYCVPKVGTPDVALQKNIDYICKRIHDGCGPIQPGGACFKVNSSLYYRAAYVMHLYYNINERRDSACDFFQTGNVTTINPTVDPIGCLFK